MARDVNKRLQQLRDRRSGIDRLGRLNEAAQREVVLKSLVEESWQKKALNKPYTRYAVGAMQEVDNNYTKKSVETAERVKNQLHKELGALGLSVEFELQGSVPANLHIRGVSDVDLLTLKIGFLIYHSNGVRGHTYIPASSTSSSKSVLRDLRSSSESVLKAQFPKATVDTSGGKAIKISGGSLERPVDVVPAHWYDTVAYQASQQKHDRGVIIFDKKKDETLENFPFLHIKRIGDVDTACLGGLKKSIRLCKNVKSDAEAEGTTIELPSFDIAATMYHADKAALLRGSSFELSILAETQRHLQFLCDNRAHAETLRVPDGSRVIFDTAAKFEGLRRLSAEVTDLALEVAREQSPYPTTIKPLNESRDILSSIYLIN